jgi:hypothetical protein
MENIQQFEKCSKRLKKNDEMEILVMFFHTRNSLKNHKMLLWNFLSYRILGKISGSFESFFIKKLGFLEF